MTKYAVLQKSLLVNFSTFLILNRFRLSNIFAAILRCFTFDFAITVAGLAINLAGRSSAARTGLTGSVSNITRTLAPRTFSLAAAAAGTTSKCPTIVFYPA